MTKIVGMFHDLCAEAIWDHDGIVNKQMGDGVMAIFNFPIRNARHAAAAVRAAIDVQRRCASALETLAVGSSGHSPEALGVGVGVHTGTVEIGEFSTFRTDFTAIGGTVNLTSRLESQAKPGEIVISAEAAAQAPELMANAVTRAFSLKGFEHRVHAHVLTTRP